MLRFSSFLTLTFFVVLVACSSDPPQTTPLASDGSMRAVTCNGQTCRGDEFCCGSTGWGDAACAASCGDKHPIFCDDASDCPESNQCCFILEGQNSIVSSQCATICPIQEDRGQLCNTTTNDCEDGKCTPMPVAPSGLSQCIKN